MRHTPLAVGQAWVRNGGNPAKVFDAVAITWAESKHSDEASSFCCHGVWALHEEHTPISCSRNLDCATKRAIELSSNGKDWSPWDVHPESSGRTGFVSSHPAIKNYETGLKIAKRNRGLRRLVDLKTPLGDLGAPGPDLDFTNPLGPLSPVNPLDGIPNVKNPFEAGLNPIAGLKEISAFFVGLGELVLTPEGWLRIAKMAGGAILFLWGLRIFIRISTGSDPVRTSKGVVTKAAELAAFKGAVKG